MKPNLILILTLFLLPVGVVGQSLSKMDSINQGVGWVQVPCTAGGIGCGVLHMVRKSSLPLVPPDPIAFLRSHSKVVVVDGDSSLQITVPIEINVDSSHYAGDAEYALSIIADVNYDRMIWDQTLRPADTGWQTSNYDWHAMDTIHDSSIMRAELGFDGSLNYTPIDTTVPTGQVELTVKLFDITLDAPLADVRIGVWKENDSTVANLWCTGNTNIYGEIVFFLDQGEYLIRPTPYDDLNGRLWITIDRMVPLFETLLVSSKIEVVSSDTSKKYSFVGPVIVMFIIAILTGSLLIFGRRK